MGPSEMNTNPRKAYNALPDLPSGGNIETAGVLQAVIGARNCFVPFSSGIKLNDLVKVDLWDMFYMEAPRRRTEFEKKHTTLKRASRPSLHAMESTSRPFIGVEKRTE
jgi:hypothetical protein